MGEAERFLAQQAQETADKARIANARSNNELSAEIRRLVPRAIARLKTDGYPYLGCRKDRVMWQGEPRVGWRLHSRPGDGRYDDEVYLLADGVMIVSVQDNRYNVTWQVFEPSHFSDPKDLEEVVSWLRHIAPKEQPKKPKRRFW